MSACSDLMCVSIVPASWLSRCIRTTRGSNSIMRYKSIQLARRPMRCQIGARDQREQHTIHILPLIGARNNHPLVYCGPAGRLAFTQPYFSAKSFQIGGDNANRRREGSRRRARVPSHSQRCHNNLVLVVVYVWSPIQAPCKSGCGRR